MYVNIVPIAFFVFGCVFCMIADRPDLVGLGMIILAGLLRIAFGYDDTRLDELNKRIAAVKKDMDKLK